MSIIAVIDSGIDQNCEAYRSVVDNYVLYENDVVKRYERDEVGHGTGVASVLYDNNPKAELIVFKIFHNEIKTSQKSLYIILDYIYCNIKELKIDFINISLGVLQWKDERLENICNKLVNEGCIIISAFDNVGAISYPASFPTVVGVDVTKEYMKKNDIYAGEDSLVSYFVPDIYYRVNSLDGKKSIVRGTSYACAKVTGVLSSSIDTKEKKEEFIKHILAQKNLNINNRHSFKIKKAIIFPYNKESDVIIRNNKLLDFEVVDIFDEPLKGKIGKEICGYTVKSYKDIDFREKDIDTLILSCTDELSRHTKRDYKKYFDGLCKTNNINIYSFEKIETNYSKCFYPKTDKNDIPINQHGKLRALSIPIVGVVGTSSKQGKFTLQIKLKNELENRGYNTGFLATEPSGYLFGADYVFPMGYNTTVDLGGNLFDYILVLNNELWNMEHSNKEIILVGSQSGSVQYDNVNLAQYTINQYGFIIGTMPDAFILVVNIFDTISYIERTINYLNSVVKAKVVAIVVFPIVREMTIGGIYYKNHIVENSEIEQFKNRLREKISIPILNEGDTDAIVDIIIDYF